MVEIKQYRCDVLEKSQQRPPSRKITGIWKAWKQPHPVSREPRSSLNTKTGLSERRDFKNMLMVDPATYMNLEVDLEKNRNNPDVGCSCVSSEPIQDVKAGGAEVHSYPTMQQVQGQPGWFETSPPPQC